MLPFKNVVKAACTRETSKSKWVLKKPVLGKLSTDPDWQPSEKGLFNMFYIFYNFFIKLQILFDCSEGNHPLEKNT